MATSYVETAILRVRDESSKPLAKINRELSKLFATARKPLKIDIRGLDKLARDAAGVKNLSSEIAKLSRRSAIRIPVSLPGADVALRQAKQLNAELAKLRASGGARLPVTMPGPRRPGQGGYGGGTISAGLQSGFNPFQVGRDLARSFTIGFGQEMANMAGRATTVAAVAPLTMEEAQARVRTSGRTDSELAKLQDIATRQSQRVGSVSQADLLGNSVDVTGGIGSLELPENLQMAEAALGRMADSAAIMVTSLGMGAKEAAEQARQIEKQVQIMGAATDPAEALRISRASVKASIATGGDVAPAEMTRLLQQLGSTFVAGMSEEALMQVGLLRDEGGKMSTAEVRMAFQDMTRGNLNEDDMAAQIRSGLRDKNGVGIYADQFQKNPMAVVNEVIIPKLQALGVDIKDAAAVSAALDDQLGLTTTGVRFFTAAVVNAEQRKIELERAKKTDLEYAMENPTTRAQGQAVQAQFENIAADIGGIALPLIKGGLDTLGGALGNVAAGQAGVADYAAIAAAATPLAVGAAMAGIADPLTRPMSLAGLALTGSAAALDASAVALAASAAAIGGKSAMGGAAATAAGGGIVGAIGRFLRSAAGRVALPLALVMPDKMGSGNLGERDRAQFEDQTKFTRGLRQANMDRRALPSTLAQQIGELQMAQINRGSNSRMGRGIYVREARLGASNEAEALKRVFDDGALSVAKSGKATANELYEATSAFGPAVANALLSVAGQMGQAIGTAAASQMRGIQIVGPGIQSPVNNQPRIDTGGMGPQ